MLTHLLERWGSYLRYHWAKFRLSAEADADEMEVWSELLWVMSSLVATGCTLPTVCKHLLNDTDAEYREMPAHTNKKTLDAPLSVVYARADQELFLRAALTRMSAGYSLLGLTNTLPFQRAHSRLRAQQILACWHMSARTGAPLQVLCENLAAHCENDTDAFEARVSALSGPKTTGSILSWLPLLGLGLGMLMGTNPLGFLMGSLPGFVLGGIGCGLALYGRRWTQKLVTRAERLEL
ncbi:hypothetical protein [Rothia sp. ZJ1223]|uniref:hypothetical protein n=1 Tax=Rothia sp. ZJ1223 TaxID=2811098 RepID=UPI00195E70B5|nr:hypothetical protein [Rothia sp. ZJ1223]MBM7051970.1 hypothetical protein [Rothia sp. ZJ1223]